MNIENRRLLTMLRWMGGLLVGLGLIGFLTVADDLRHTGELLGVGSILAAGLLLLSVALYRRRKK